MAHEDVPQVATQGSTISLPITAVQSALDALGDILAVVDPQGQIVAVNQAWRSFTAENGGDEQTGGLGTNYLRACEGLGDLPADEGPTVALGLRRVLAGAQPDFEMEYPCHSPTQERWFKVHVNPFPHGGERYAVILHEDITERRHTEIRQSDLDSEVAQKVHSRTLELRTERDELNAFIGSVSHDLRTPVRHVRSFLELFQRNARDRLSADDQRLLDVIGGAAGRLDSMIEELLGLARVSQSSMTLQPVNLAQVVLRAWTHMAPETQGREIEWVAHDLPVVHGDPDLLRLAFENLLNNAIKYTSGREQARIEVGARNDPHEWVVFVQDDGVGFDPRHTGRLFGTFQRLHSEREFAGVGMGLANVKRIVERHGGRVWAEGRPGSGATFFLAFPRPAAESRPADTALF
ncbi:sensor histidine kinase [Deinococcus koreensis]|uniref:histidine kinase n=1 Tax=Deinococcus koreensis TaxID=2054903 RepID=A0A2K3UY26_9DEIO|nr:ATP-binding protein [Deinococcus koreensis]PNY81426.1 hypothetical protein CVO96_08545 [Deinococcus koreensis]